MLTASPYISSGSIAIYDRDVRSAGFVASNGITYYTTKDYFLNYIKNDGNTYIIPFASGLATSYLSEKQPNSITSASQIKFYVDLWKLLGPNNIGMQNFNSHTWLTANYDDRLVVSGTTTTLYNDDTFTNTIGATNSYYTAWPEKGISASYNLLDNWFSWLKTQGVTIDALMNDWEGTPFNPGFESNINIYNALINDSRFYQPWKGLSSWNELYAFYGGNCSAGLPNSSPNVNSWWPIPYAYVARAFQLGMLDPLLKHFPNAIMSNYKTYQEDFVSPMNTGEPNHVDAEDGRRLTKILSNGNAGAPELYASMRQSTNKIMVNPYEGKRLDLSFSGNTNYFRQFNKKVQRGPWASFILGLAETRAAKRGRPNQALTPWVGPVNWVAVEYIRNSLEYRLSGGYDPQSPAEVLSTTTYQNNLTVTKGYIGQFNGFTGWNGSTASFQVVTPKLGVTGASGGLWYKSNIIGVTYDGSTSSYKITTIGSTGVTASLAIFYGRPLLTTGVTYVFSYYIDLNRGYTGSQARFIRWTTSDDSLTVPNRPTTTTNSTGITFQQILPVTGSFVNGSTFIQYNAGDSGWTKVSWRFVAPSTINTSTSGIGMHVYHGLNSLSTTGGYETYIKDVSFQIEGSTALYINPIDYVFRPSNAYSSLEYFYNGITSGITYVFSYYRNMSIGNTYSPTNQQKIENFKNWGYNYPRGITFNRVLPSSAGPYYNTGPADYSGYTGWVQISYEFTPYKPFNDINDNNSLSLSLVSLQNGYSVMDNTVNVGGLTTYYAHPRLEIKGASSNIDLFFREATDEYNFIEWNDTPSIGFCNAKLGYNPESGMYIVGKPGNSAYYYEYIRQLALLGTKHFGFFNPPMFANYGFTGSLQNWVNRGKSNNLFFDSSFSLQNGWTGYLDYQKEFDNTLHDVNTKIGGFTLTTADYSEYDWNSPYFANGAPSLNGTTWWWRVTVKPGYTMYVNGITLSARGNCPVGAWYGATGQTLANAGITWTAWELPSEPGYTAPNKDINFLTMNSLANLIASGLTFGRNSIGTYMGPSGYLMIGVTGQPRFEYDPATLQPLGLLLENTTTNFLNWSESFANTGGTNNNWIDINLTRVSGNTSPAGTTNAIRFIATSGNGSLIATNSIGGATTCSWSCWFRGITGNETVQVTLDGGTSWQSITGIGNTWNRFGSSLTKTTYGITLMDMHLGFRLGNTNDSVEIWGAQVESRLMSRPRSPYPYPYSILQYTSYIPTTSSRVTRADEFCRLEGTSFSSVIGNTQGTIFVEATNLFQMGLQTVVSNNPNMIEFYIDTTGSSIQVSKRSSNQSTSCASKVYWPYPQSGFPLNIPIKTMFTYNPYGLKISSNGNIGYSNYDGTSVINNYILLNFTLSSGQIYTSPYHSLHMKKFKYWDYVWNEEDMKAMTLANEEQITVFNYYG